MMKKILKLTLFITISFGFGFISMGYLSTRASVVFLEIIRLNYQREQQIMAVKAKKLGDINQAIIYYGNLVAASSSPGLSCFSKKETYWSLSFPITSLILEKIGGEDQSRESKKVEAINRAMLADVLEKAGRSEEAMLEYIKASHLLGCDDDIGKVKNIVKQVLSFDDELLKLKEKKGSGANK